MPILNIDICGPSYTLDASPITANQSSVNMYPIMSAPSNSVQSNNPLYASRGRATMIPTAGFELLATTSPGGSGQVTGCSGIYIAQVVASNGPSSLTNISLLCYAVMQGRLMEFTVNYFGNDIGIIGPTDYGTVANFTDPRYATRFSSNGSTLLIIAGGNCRAFNMLTKTLSSPTLPFSGSIYPIGGVNIDGYFFIAAGNPALGGVQDQFYSSDLNATTFNASNTARMQSKPDGIVGLLANKGELWGFNTSSIEVWYDNGNNPGMPFSKRVGSDIGTGTYSPHALINIDDNIFWVDSRGFVAMSSFNQFFRNQSSGYQITKVSDESIDQWLGSLPTLRTLIASTYIDRGNIMYELTYPTITSGGVPLQNGRTFVLNTNNFMWHEKQYTDPNTRLTQESYTTYYATYGNLVLAGSVNDNNIYVLGSHLTPLGGGGFSRTIGAYTDNGAPIYRYRQTKIFTTDFKQTTVNSIEIKVMTGLVDGATIDMRYSIDSGFTWSNWLTRSLGNTGDYNKRVTWNDLGTAHEWELEFRININGKWSIVEAIANLTYGSI